MHTSLVLDLEPISSSPLLLESTVDGRSRSTRGIDGRHKFVSTQRKRVTRSERYSITADRAPRSIRINFSPTQTQKSAGRISF